MKISNRQMLALVAAPAIFLCAAAGAELSLKLKHKKPADIAALIGSEISASGALNADNAAMTLIVRERPDRFGYFRQRILELDIPPQPFAMKVSLGLMPLDAVPAPGVAAAPAAPQRIASAERRILEGEGADLPLEKYRLHLGLGLYDARNKQLRISEMKLYAAVANGRPVGAPILSLAARLKTGRPTVFAVDRAGGTLVLQITPTPMPVAPDTEPERR